MNNGIKTYLTMIIAFSINKGKPLERRQLNYMFLVFVPVSGDSIVFQIK